MIAINTMNIFRTLAVSFTLSMFLYVSHQLVRFADMSPWLKLAVVLGLGSFFAIVAAAFIYLGKEKDLRHTPRRDAMMNVSLTLMAYINFLVTLVLIRDVYALVEYFASSNRFDRLYDSEAAIILILLPAFLVMLGHIVVRVGPRLTKIPVFFKDLPPALEGVRILHITDLHISPSLPADFVAKLVEQAHKTFPDIVVLTGDILDSFVEKHGPEMAHLGELRAKHGVFFVTGNHEYYWNAPKAMQTFRDAGYRVLVNEVANLSFGSGTDAVTLQIAGVPDPAAAHFRQEGPDFAKVQTQLQKESFKLMLAHQPILAKHAQALGMNLQLSGHTHGGQFFPWNFIIKILQPYSKGLYELGNMRLYVNQGTGYWGPRLRLGTYCELAEIVLRKG